MQPSLQGRMSVSEPESPGAGAGEGDEVQNLTTTGRIASSEYNKL